MKSGTISEIIDNVVELSKDFKGGFNSITYEKNPFVKLRESALRAQQALIEIEKIVDKHKREKGKTNAKS